MKVLYIVPFVPWEIRVRSFNLIPRLARRHEIYLVSVSTHEPTMQEQAWIDRYCRKSVHVKQSLPVALAHCLAALPTGTPLRMAYCRSREAQAAVRRFSDEVLPDVVYVERWRALDFLPEAVAAPLVCDPTDSMTLYNQRLLDAGSWWERLVAWGEHRKFSKCEGKLAMRPDACVFCSRVDLEAVQAQAPEARFELVPNGVDCRSYFFKDESEEQPGAIAFTGRLEYGPNRHAAEFFLNRVFPLIQSEVPGASFTAVGKGAPRVLARYSGRPGFHAVDFVPDLRPFLARAAVTVAPLTVGAGVSNKLAEGFAVGTPVVATPLACGDLPVTSGNQLLIASDEHEFARHTISLLKDASLRRAIAARARRFVEGYDWEVVAGKMENLLEEIGSKHSRESGERALATTA